MKWKLNDKVIYIRLKDLYEKLLKWFWRNLILLSTLF